MKEGWGGEPPPQTPGFCLALDWVAPVDVFRRFSAVPYVSFLESGGPLTARSRCSYLGVYPHLTLCSRRGTVFANGRAIADDPFTAVEKALARYVQAGLATPAPFAGGAIGFLGYGLRHVLDDLPASSGAALDFPDMVMSFYDIVFAFDHEQQRVWLTSPARPEERARQRLDMVRTQLETPLGDCRTAPPPVCWRADTSRDQHMQRVGRARDYIWAGDIYQANITARFTAERPPGASAADIFLAVRGENPAPFSAFLDCGEDGAIVSASPERACRLHADGRIEARPIKGTSPRGATAADDARLAKALLASEKDRAENLMIVDLLRHDISRVAVTGSVRVTELCALESFASVHHLVSTIEGELRPGLGPVDVLRATFPGGSVTGAPKIRAMQIIAELESSPRGPYCGTACWIGSDGAMDSNILIRTVVVTRDTVAANAGGGIVADSDPAAEYDEMMLKIRPLLESLGAGINDCGR